MLVEEFAGSNSGMQTTCEKASATFVYGYSCCSLILQEDKQRILELREYAKEARMGVAAMGVRRVEKIEGDLLKKMPNKFKVT